MFLIARLWLYPLGSSFWVDEMVTAFVVNHPGHPSFAIAPQVPESIYYGLPRLAQGIFGSSEIVYRIPSVLVMALALYLIGRLAVRLIHPEAAWLALFACLGLRWFNYFAIDARPYALGICVASACLLFLIRWFDDARIADAVAFIAFAALLWRVHLIYWPFYLILAGYAASRLWSNNTRVKWLHATGVFAIAGLSLIPVALKSLPVLHEAASHVITKPPEFRTFEHEIRWILVLSFGGGAWLLNRILRPAQSGRPASPGLVAALWLTQPVALFAFSHFTGNSVFIDRYLSLGLVGTALAATAAAAYGTPSGYWKTAALAAGLGAVIFTGHGTYPASRHERSDWRAAARTEAGLALDAATPVICPSPFVEARTPVWHPDYPLPGFLYSHLSYYPLKGKTYLFPFETSDGADYAVQITPDLAHTRRFMIYGGDTNVRYWRKWFAARPELSTWQFKTLEFGDVSLAVFNAPGTS